MTPRREVAVRRRRHAEVATPPRHLDNGVDPVADGQLPDDERSVATSELGHEIESTGMSDNHGAIRSNGVSDNHRAIPSTGMSKEFPIVESRGRSNGECAEARFVGRTQDDRLDVDAIETSQCSDFESDQESIESLNVRTPFETSQIQGNHDVTAASQRREVFENGFESNGFKKSCVETTKGFELLRWSDMPRHLQFNPHIRTGYRPLMSVRQCLGSLFYIHNETVNITTHGFAILYMLLTVPYLLPWGSQGTLYNVLSWCHLIGAVSPWVGSFTYHLFMNLNHDEIFYKCLLKLDMIGIWLCQSFGAIPMMAASVHCLSDIPWYICIFIYCSLCIWGLLKAMYARSPWERRLCFAPPFLMRMLVLTFRCFGIGGGSPDALAHIILQDLIAVIGATIGAMRIPEKLIPGRLDLAFNSHNLMHVMVVLAVCSMHAATLQDLAWMVDPLTCNGTYHRESTRRAEL